MWLLIFLFLSATLLISWILFGYLLFIWMMGRFGKRIKPRLPNQLPFISVVVPCYNEAEQILEKLSDIRRQDYPRDRLEVIFCDGGSTDGTFEMLEAAICPGEPFRAIRCPRRGKIHQINYVLPVLRGTYVVNTDADARLSPAALKWMAAEFLADAEVRVVGAYCYPIDTIKIEHYYWDAQNKGRFMESDAHTSSIVISQCYAFHRGLIEVFPEDVVADDIYVSFLSNALGYRTVYSRLATAGESRTPQNYEDFLPHKFRKSNAFLRESFRFLYLLPQMKPFFRMLLLTRIAQQMLLPWAMIFWVALAGSLSALHNVGVVLMGSFLLLGLFAVTSRVFAWVPLPGGGRKHSILTVIKGYFLTNLVMLATGLTYPFFRQGCSYRRLKNEYLPVMENAGHGS